ncbi:DNA polymerase Y family protein [Lentzea jiangxiensis]|uniref:Protein ImuB n=1 Tax=Lentzea jiangxiensis TaxID=641025 RepID=A0A1H0EGK3_9PSEU|nr:DNA polymerase Y family protein [Lentzea jiangxiensis]SDN81451.1 protein ImuB [Lentzea jiangxiensis]
MKDTRLIAVWSPDWPVVAACTATGTAAHVPVAVVDGNEVVSASAVARREGIRRAMRKRAAQAVCPELVTFEHDPQRDARYFEPVAEAVEELAPGVEVVQPGLVAVPAQGPVTYFGSAEQVAECIVDHVAARTGTEVQVGLADSLFAATKAAHRGVVVPQGRTAEFLGPLGVHELDAPELVDLLRRLGLKTLGAFAEIPEKSVTTRFGGPATRQHRLARGLPERPLDKRRPAPELAVAETFDEPVGRIDSAAFAAKVLSERLHENLSARGLACTRLGIHARTENGEELHRVWRAAEPLTPRGIADRVRWQLDGWLTRERLTSGIRTLTLEPAEVVDGTALQLGLWGHDDERAVRALLHVQGLLGPDGVLTPVLDGGRGPKERVRLVPWGDERTPVRNPDHPWPGRLTRSPATLADDPAELEDENGVDVGVTGRLELTARPKKLVVRGRAREITAWAGPWPVDERWWAPDPHRAARVQVQTNEQAFLLVRRDQRWFLEGVYD